MYFSIQRIHVNAVFANLEFSMIRLRIELSLIDVGIFF